MSEAQQCTVDPSDGISEVEAYKIACEYFFGRGFTPCGIVDVPKDDGKVWRVPLLEGYFGVPSHDVIVAKLDGAYHIEPIKTVSNEPSKPASVSGTNREEVRTPASNLTHL